MSQKLPAVPGKAVIKALQKAGFIRKRVSGSHYVMSHARSGRSVIVPFNKRVSKAVLLTIIKGSGLSRSEFLELL